VRSEAPLASSATRAPTAGRARAAFDLTRVTVSTPQRRVDLAVPAWLPLAELLPDLLGYAGVELADAGERHGGWRLARADGTRLSHGASLGAQAVRDGDVLHLVPSRLDWPELEYDDAAEAVAASARRIGPLWSATATRAAAVVSGCSLLAAGALLYPQWKVSAGVALLLLAAAGVAVRAYHDGPAGAALAGCAMPYALAAGLACGVTGTWRAAAAGAGLVLVALVGGVATASTLPLFAAGATAGAWAVAGGVLAVRLGPAGAAALLAALMTFALGALPGLAGRLGRLPDPYSVPPPQPGVESAVRRADALLTGALAGHALAGVGAAGVLVVSGGTAGRVLAAVVGAVAVLRARMFAPVRHRVPVLAAGLASLGLLAGVHLAATGPAARSVPVAVVTAAGLAVLGAGLRYAGRAPSPYAARAADILETALVLLVVPAVCAVLGLFAKVGSLGG
jgi:type VII secretion integral membrane protein EccD